MRGTPARCGYSIQQSFDGGGHWRIRHACDQPEVRRLQFGLLRDGEVARHRIPRISGISLGSGSTDRRRVVRV